MDRGVGPPRFPRLRSNFKLLCSPAFRRALQKRNGHPGKASGSPNARMAMYCAVHVPMPAICCGRPTARLNLRSPPRQDHCPPGADETFSAGPRHTALLDRRACQNLARRKQDPVAEWRPIRAGNPAGAASRRLSRKPVVLKSLLTASSNPSHAPGTRSPGRFFTRSPSTESL